MDITSLIIGILIMALFIFPAVLFARHQGKRKRNLLREINRKAKELSLDIHEKETWRKRALALDNKSLKLISAVLKDNQTELKTIDLSGISTVVINEQYTYGVNDKNKTLLSMRLDFLQQKTGNVIHSIDLYEADVDMYPDFEKNRAVKWKQFVENCIAGMKKASRGEMVPA